jgi:hypothetical protein
LGNHGQLDFADSEGPDGETADDNPEGDVVGGTPGFKRVIPNRARGDTPDDSSIECLPNAKLRSWLVGQDGESM